MHNESPTLSDRVSMTHYNGSSILRPALRAPPAPGQFINCDETVQVLHELTHLIWRQIAVFNAVRDEIARGRVH